MQGDGPIVKTGYNKEFMILTLIGGTAAPFLSVETRKKVLDQCKSATGRGTPLNSEKIVKKIF